MKLTRTKTFAIIGLVYSLIVWLLPFILPETTVARLVREDSIIEYLGFLFFLISALGWLGAFIFSKTGNTIGPIHTRKNFVFLALALILFFGAGEEISWGQRLLGFETPEFMEENEQEELSVHNLPFFNTTDIGNLFQMNRLFIYFWFGMGVLLPAAAYASKKIRGWLTTWGVPIFPILLGFQFLLVYMLSKLYGPLGAVRDSYDGRISELRESEEAALFALIAVLFLLQEWENRKQRAG